MDGAAVERPMTAVRVSAVLSVIVAVVDYCRSRFFFLHLYGSVL